jgi:hypothetical protein
LTNQDVEWGFSPPTFQHFGGSWERLTQSAKRALRSVFNERTLNDEVLLTAVSDVTAQLNARPLTHVSVDPHDPQPLTPNHSLAGRANPGFHIDDVERFCWSNQKALVRISNSHHSLLEQVAERVCSRLNRTTQVAAPAKKFSR